MQKQGGSPRTPSNKPSEILTQFYHLLYSWSTAYFFENIKSNTIGKAWMKKNWALLSRLHITTRVFILPVVSGDFFFSGCCSSIIRFKESCSTVYLPTKSFGGFLKFIYARFRRTICFWNLIFFYQYNCFLGWILFKTSKTKWHNLRKKSSISFSFFRESYFLPPLNEYKASRY